MFNNDVSYLYSDGYLTSSFLYEDESLRKVSDIFECQPDRTDVYRKTAPTLATGRRSKHIILFGEEALKRDRRREKNRLAARRFKEKQQLYEENLHQKIKELENERSNLENHVTELQSHKQDLETEINNNILMDPITQLILADRNQTPLFFDQYSNDLDLFNMSITNNLNLNNDYEDHLDN